MGVEYLLVQLHCIYGFEQRIMEAAGCIMFMINKGLEVGLQKRLTVKTKVGVGSTSQSLGDEIVVCLYSAFGTSSVLVGATLVDINF